MAHQHAKKPCGDVLTIKAVPGHALGSRRGPVQSPRRVRAVLELACAPFEHPSRMHIKQEGTLYSFLCNWQGKQPIRAVLNLLALVHAWKS
eukprot:scaffold214857_cov18-Tisochrysis_lutea.AAC.1